MVHWLHEMLLRVRGFQKFLRADEPDQPNLIQAEIGGLSL